MASDKKRSSVEVVIYTHLVQNLQISEAQLLQLLVNIVNVDFVNGCSTFDLNCVCGVLSHDGIKQKQIFSIPML